MSRQDQLLKSLGLLQELGKRQNSITHVQHIPAKQGRYEDYPGNIHPALVGALKRKGFNRLYTHQHQSWTQLQDGKNIVVVTPTASGKTLCYNLPVLDTVLKKPSSRAIYMFPTKALAQDQRAELDETISLLPEEIGIFTYDGDTPQDARRAIRAKGHIILTNPDMLHTGILPHHTKWIKLFENLDYIVIDEMHNYRGIFGSHLANILRRLKRICTFYGSSPRFILCTATIANPVEVAERMTEGPVTLIDDNGAPHGEKYFIFYNPPVVNESLGIRRSYVNESRRVARLFLDSGLQTIVFAQSRLITEVLLTYLKNDIENKIRKEGLIRGYRGGYLPLRRREIEKGLREGKILGVVSTNALELGIDIGNLDVAVLAGYPGNIASTWQRAGRAGRQTSASCAVLVARSSPLDQFIINNPDYFFSKNPEKALINPDNLSILISHVECSAFEIPFVDGEKFGALDIGEVLQFLEEDKLIHHSRGKWYWTSDAYPADGVSLRSISSDNFVVVDTTGKTKAIAEVDFSAALTTLHPKAIYICEGEQYYVEKLDFDQRKAYVKKTDIDYYTDAIDYTKIKILDIFSKKNMQNCDLNHGEVHVATQVVGFKKIKFFTSENVGSGDLSLPQNEMHTTAYWLTIPSGLYNGLPFEPEEKINGLFGLAYCMHNVSPLFLMCDLRDIGVSIGDNATGKSLPNLNVLPRVTQDQEDTYGDWMDFEPNIFIYDNYPGGIGLSSPLFELEKTLLRRCFKTIQACPCKEGCPSCVGPTKESGKSAKQVALFILEKITAPV
ncbi:MAG: DEAD/DEAH box helicase [Acidobacteria bacterium]|nr:DEAD/DEAH box helicase [Acidobacteriota bacterium]MBU4329662.1 DEAD/DEAH box helicase [Acidobacteriota bacterium]MCG2814320.1 DEAD/DEAH box helicase [Candidatus Aminicenantes bacterium]